MRRILPFLLAVSLILGGCGSKNADAETTAATTAPTTAPTVATTAPTETTAAPTETEPTINWDAMSPLTGLPVDVPLNTRPFAAVINNIVYAMPQCGVRNADILYEILAEGGITRCMAIFQDPTKTGPIGSIRSARPYLADLAMGYDAIFVHAGGSDDGYRKIRDLGLDHMDGISSDYSGTYYYRDQDRLNSGYDLEHTMFITGEKLPEYAGKLNMDTTREKNMDYGLNFAEHPDMKKGEEAKHVVVEFANSGKTTTFTYHDDTNLYTAEQYGTDFIDGTVQEPLSFRNLIVITADTSYDSEGYRVFIDLTDSGEGWFVCDGKMVPILWSRENEESPFVYTLTDGTPLTLGTGKSYIAVTPYGSTVTCE